MSGPNMMGGTGLLFSLITAALFCKVAAQTVRGRYLNAACQVVSLKPEFRYRIIQVLISCDCFQRQTVKSQWHGVASRLKSLFYPF